jgi:hypothetical protein
MYISGGCIGLNGDEKMALVEGGVEVENENNKFIHKMPTAHHHCGYGIATCVRRIMAGVQR